MEADELLREAWAAVEKARIPAPLHEAAFREAVDYLRSGKQASNATAHSKAEPAPDTKKRRRSNTAGRTPAVEPAAPRVTPTDGEFFSTLATESGVPEAELRDVLRLVDGKVLITPPTKNLGSTVSEQARTAIALVASGRAIGLAENPVIAEEVRQELQRKRCYDGPNFAVYHLAPMKGFNAGANRTEIVLTSKWLDEFKAAVAKARGSEPERTKDK